MSLSKATLSAIQQAGTGLHRATEVVSAAVSWQKATQYNRQKKINTGIFTLMKLMVGSLVPSFVILYPLAVA